MTKHSNWGDPISPNYYMGKNNLQVIDVIASFTEGLDGVEAWVTGCIIKYVCRWKHKNGLEDLKKARWYLNKLIAYLEQEQETEVELKESNTTTLYDMVAKGDK